MPPGRKLHAKGREACFLASSVRIRHTAAGHTPTLPYLRIIYIRYIMNFILTFSKIFKWVQ